MQWLSAKLRRVQPPPCPNMHNIYFFSSHCVFNKPYLWRLEKTFTMKNKSQISLLYFRLNICNICETVIFFKLWICCIWLERGVWEIRGALVSWLSTGSPTGCMYCIVCKESTNSGVSKNIHYCSGTTNTYNSPGFLRLHVALHAFCTHRLWLPNHHFTANSMSCICPSSFCVACNCIFTSPNHHYKIIFNFVLLTIGNTFWYWIITLQLLAVLQWVKLIFNMLG